MPLFTSMMCDGCESWHSTFAHDLANTATPTATLVICNGIYVSTPISPVQKPNHMETPLSTDHFDCHVNLHILTECINQFECICQANLKSMLARGFQIKATTM